MNFSLLTCIVLSLAYSSFALVCRECKNALSDADCERRGVLRECHPNENQCQIEIRFHRGWGPGYRIFKHCKQGTACDNNFVQNPRAAWKPTQCIPTFGNSVCRCCCDEDRCNVAQTTCFKRSEKMLCRLPPQVWMGTVECTNGREAGSRCTTTCNGGAVLRSGYSTDTYCKSSGAWSHPFGQCERQSCERRPLDNGWMSYSNNVYLGSVETPRCNHGFDLVGSGGSRCVKTVFGMDWSEPPAFCQKRQCPDRGLVEGGTEVCEDGRNTQSHCEVVCDDSRTLNGATNYYCQDSGEWSHPQPTCDKVTCPPRGTVLNGDVTCSDDVEVDSVCQVTCDEGFAPDGEIESICLGNGDWDKALPRCTRARCPPRGTVEDGRVSCTDGTFAGSICKVRCDKNTDLIGGVDTSECLINGKWDEPLPKCLKLDCQERGVVINGEVVCTDGNKVGSVCRTNCDEGYAALGTLVSTCTSTSIWNLELPTCERIKCPPRGSVVNGEVSCTDGRNEGSSCTVTCNDNAKNRGPLKSKCLKNGKWNKPLPKCEEIKCPPRGSVQNGAVSCTDGVKAESICTTTCNTNSELDGEATSECLNNGKWDTPLPVCKELKCVPRGSVENGVVTCNNGVNAGSVCNVVCDDGTEIQGPPQSECLRSGKWNRPLPRCRVMPCDNQGRLRHGSISCSNDSLVGSECTFECSGVFELFPKGRAKNLCLPTQQWNVPKPCCHRPCPPYALMDLVIVLDSSSSIQLPNWRLMTRFVGGFINVFEIGPEAANIGIFRYNREVDKNTEIFLKDYNNNKDGLLKAFEDIPYDGAGTLTGNALSHALESHLTAAAGNRPDVVDVVLLLTDGKARDEVRGPAEALRASGAIVFALGIEPPPGKGKLDVKELETIAGSKDNVIIPQGGFKSLTNEFSLTLSKQICGNPCERN